MAIRFSARSKSFRENAGGNHDPVVLLE